MSEAMSSPETTLAAALCDVAEHLDACNYGDAARALISSGLLADVWAEGWRAGRQRVVGGQDAPNPYAGEDA